MRKLAVIALLALSTVSSTAAAADRPPFLVAPFSSEIAASASDAEGFLAVPEGLERGYEFPGTRLKTTAPVYTFNLTNIGTGPVDVRGVAIAAGREDFNQSNTCGATLAVGAQCHISVSFTPTEQGTQQGWLTVMSTANSFSIELRGDGCANVESTAPCALKSALASPAKRQRSNALNRRDAPTRLDGGL